MNNYIAEWIMDNAPTNNSEEARLFEKAMRENPDYFELLQKLQGTFHEWKAMHSREQIKATLVYDNPKLWEGIKKLFQEKFYPLVSDDLYALKLMKDEIERTFAWLNNSRRLSKNYEYSMTAAETMVKISHLHTLLKRL